MALDRQEVLKRLQQHLRSTGAHQLDEDLGEDVELFHLDLSGIGEKMKLLQWADGEFGVATAPSTSGLTTIGDVVTRIVQAPENLEAPEVSK